MTSFCDCPTCKEINDKIMKKTNKDKPLCPYCDEHHDYRIHCKKEVEQTSIKTMAEIGATYFVDVDNGKYSVYQKRNGSVKALRYGKHWRDLCGDNLVFNLMVELIEAKKKIKDALAILDKGEWGRKQIVNILERKEE